MDWLVVFMIVAFFRDRAEDEPNLREAQRLLRAMRTESVAQPPESPQPHQLLGDIARPLVPSARANCYRGCVFARPPPD